ncbi:MAG: ABC transporter ATP-binding protein, partial [Spirochaetota bacterium]
NVSLAIPHGKTLALIGPSGCGKTMLMRIIAGLEYADSGDVLFDDINVNDLGPEKRRTGIVFQHYALYPHMTAQENMTTYFLFDKKNRKNEKLKEEIFRQTSELLGVEMEHLLSKKPPKLSGGDRQRVALGRCITREPNLFLMDEPLANLDARERETYRIKLKALLSKLETTALYITHDQHEAMVIGDIIAVMRDGRIEQTGTFDDVFNHPANMYVADFISLTPGVKPVNFFDGRRYADEYAGYTAGVRCEDTVVNITAGRPGYREIRGTVEAVTHLYSHQESYTRVSTELGDLSSRMAINQEIGENMKVWISFRKIHLFDPDTKVRVHTVDQSKLYTQNM